MKTNEENLLMLLESSLNEKEIAKKSLLAFTECLNYTNAPFQEDWLNFLQYKFNPFKDHPDHQKKYLLLWPRGHAKTEITTINYVSWLVGNNHDVHINLISKTASLAESILTALMTRFETDKKYKQIFGELKPKNPRKWTSQQIIVERNEISKNPTIKATGLMGAITGGRSDLVICDDVIDEENIRTRLQIEKVSTWFNKVLIPTLYPWGGILVVGTRWSYADIYGQLIESWPHDIKKAIQDDGTSLWPDYWTLEKLQQRREDIGSVFFNCQYQNDPTGMTGELLKAEWLHPWEEHPSPNIFKYAGVDPALGEGDQQAIATMGYDQTKQQGYLIDVWSETVAFPSFLEKLRQLHVLHDYSKIYFESNAFQKVLSFLPEIRQLPAVPTHTSKNKEQRFIPMSSHFEAKRILVNPLMLSPNNEFFIQWIQFPRGQYDDAVDSVEIVTRNTLAYGGAIEALTGRRPR